jgi:hypothetical protein
VLAQLVDQPGWRCWSAATVPTAAPRSSCCPRSGRQYSEVCQLVWDRLHYDTQTDETGSERRLPVLVHDMPKVARRGCRLPVDEATVQIIVAQNRRVRDRDPDTRQASCGSAAPNRHVDGRPPDGVHRTRAHPAQLDGRAARLVDLDGGAFDRGRVVPYAFRHSYAHRHVDHGAPIEGAARSGGRESLVTTQGYFRIGDQRAPLDPRPFRTRGRYRLSSRLAMIPSSPSASVATSTSSVCATKWRGVLQPPMLAGLAGPVLSAYEEPHDPCNGCSELTDLKTPRP